MQLLGAGEVERRLGEPAVGDEHDDIALVHRPAGAVEDLQVWSAHRGPGQPGPPVLALDDPAPPVRVGGLHIRAVVPGTADLHRVRAPVTLHQVPYGVLELPVVQSIQLRQRIPQSLGAHPLPPCCPLPADQPDRCRPAAEQQHDDWHPRIGTHEVHYRRQHGPRDDQAPDKEEELIGAVSLTRPPPRAHRPSPFRSHLIGYDTVGTGSGLVCFHPGQRIGYDTAGAGAGRGVGLSHPGHLTGYVTRDEGRGAGNRSAPAAPPVDVPEPPKTNTTATIPMARAVCLLVPAGALQCALTTVPSCLVYPLMNGKAEAPSPWSNARSPRNRPM